LHGVVPIVIAKDNEYRCCCMLVQETWQKVPKTGLRQSPTRRLSDERILKTTITNRCRGYTTLNNSPPCHATLKEPDASYRVGQIKRGKLTVLLVTSELIYKIKRFWQVYTQNNKWHDAKMAPAPRLSSLTIKSNSRMCKESPVVLRSLENTTRYFSKNR